MRPTTVLNEITNSSDAFVTTFAITTPPFSNWSPHKVTIWGQHFSTAEHAYQYKKFADIDPVLALKIKRARCPGDAKRLGWSKLINTAAWDHIRESIMREIVMAKLNQHQEVRQALYDTGLRAIVQQADSDDDLFWSAQVTGEGRNTMGLIWTSLKQTLDNPVSLPRQKY